MHGACVWSIRDQQDFFLFLFLQILKEMGRKESVWLVWEGNVKEKSSFVSLGGKWEGMNKFCQCWREMGRK